MNDLDGDKFLKFLVDKWGASKRCPMCDNPTWEFANKMAEVREMVQPGLTTLGSLPVVPVTCTNCGNTILISAAKAGVWKPQSKTLSEIATLTHPIVRISDPMRIRLEDLDDEPKKGR